MKTLKFMLAAATAIGLASATQADQYNTTGFEKLAVGTNVTTGVQDNRTNYSYFYYAGNTAEDNESVIVAGTPDIARPRGASAVDATRNNILQVSTGTDPLLRTYQGFTGSTPVAPTTLAGDVYVDTLVQFTVTPYTDTVTPSNGVDKLLIYLKESVVTNELGVITSASTNLVVVGGYYNGEAFLGTEYVAQEVDISPNTWHRLTVKVIVNYGGLSGYQHPAFLVYLDGDEDPVGFDKKPVAEDKDGYASPFDEVEDTTAIDNKNVVFSLLCTGNAPASLQGVGFAGEGKVDDIVFSDLNPFANVFNFTFTAWDSEKVDAVSYTVGAASYIQAGTYEVEEGTKVKINSITYASGWEEGSFTVVGLADPDQDGYYTVTNTASFTIVPAEVQSTPLKPGEQDPTTYNTQADAEAAAAKVVIGLPPAVSTAFAGDTTKEAAYKALFEAKVVSDGAGGYKVEVGLTDAAKDGLQDQVDDDAAEVIEDLSAATVTLTTTPGLYYSFEYGTTLGTMTEGARTLATGDTLTLDRPTTANATAGFYKVLVNVTDKE